MEKMNCKELCECFMRLSLSAEDEVDRLAEAAKEELPQSEFEPIRALLHRIYSLAEDGGREL